MQNPHSSKSPQPGADLCLHVHVVKAGDHKLLLWVLHGNKES